MASLNFIHLKKFMSQVPNWNKHSLRVFIHFNLAHQCTKTGIGGVKLKYQAVDGLDVTFQSLTSL